MRILHQSSHSTTSALRLLAVMSLLLLVSCAKSQLASELSDVEKYISDQPDSALAVLMGIDTLQLRSNALKAKYSLLYAMALDKNYIDTTDVSVVIPAVNYYSKWGKPEDKLKSYFYLGCIQMNGGDLNSAAISLSVSEQEAARVNDDKAKGLLYMAFADVYNKMRIRDRELDYLNKGMESFAAAGDTTNRALASGRLALYYYGTQQWTVADSLFREGLAFAKDNTVAMSLFLSNYARMKVAQPNKDPEGAISLLDDLRLKYKQRLSLTDYGVYAYASSLVGDEATCSQIEKQLLNLDDSKRRTISYWLYKIELNRKNYEKALNYQILSSEHNSARVEHILSQSAVLTLQDYYANEAKQIHQKSWHAKVRFIIIIAGILILSFALSWRLKKRQEMRIQEVVNALRLSEESSKILQHNLSTQVSSNEGLKDSLESLRQTFVSQYKDKFSTLGNICRAYLESEGRTDRPEYMMRRMESMIADIRDDGKFQATFEDQINADLNDIVKHLKDDLGEVDDTDSRFICYCIAGFAPEVIGTLLGISVSNVYTKKSRMKAKIRQMESPYKEQYLLIL